MSGLHHVLNLRGGGGPLLPMLGALFGRRNMVAQPLEQIDIFTTAKEKNRIKRLKEK